MKVRLTASQRKKKRLEEHAKIKQKKELEKLNKPLFGSSSSIVIQVQAAPAPFRRETKNYPSAKPILKVEEPAEEMTEEFKEREALAREEANRKKKQVAILYNKGSYQYIGNTDPKDLGR